MSYSVIVLYKYEWFLYAIPNKPKQFEVLDLACASVQVWRSEVGWEMLRFNGLLFWVFCTYVRPYGICLFSYSLPLSLYMYVCTHIYIYVYI